MIDIIEFSCKNCGSQHLKKEGNYLVCEACGSTFYIENENIIIPEDIPQKTDANKTSSENTSKTSSEKIKLNKERKTNWECCLGVFYIFLWLVTFRYLSNYNPGAGLIISTVIVVILAYVLHKVIENNKNKY